MLKQATLSILKRHKKKLPANLAKLTCYSNIAISGAQVNSGITAWKFIPRIWLGLVMETMEEKDKVQSQERADENHFSVMKRKKQHLFFSILLYLSHINMPVGPIYAYIYI